MDRGQELAWNTRIERKPPTIMVDMQDKETAVSPEGEMQKIFDMTTDF